MAYISFQNIQKDFGSHSVLKNINLEIEKGELVTLLGPSGCGKSTLLRCLAGLETVTSGNILLDGKDITQTSAKDRGIGMVFQQYSLFPNMTVEKNVAFGLKMQKKDNVEIKKRVKDILEIVGLSDRREAYPSQLSGGQQQRAALARALVTEPKVLLLDEPLSAIDALLRHSLQVEIRRIQKELNITAIFVTHDQDEAMVMSDHIHLMHDGHIEQSATPLELYTHPKTSFAASFIGHYNVLTPDELKKMTGTSPVTSCENIAIRPEVITMNAGQPAASEDEYTFHGKIAVSLPHGNIIRYGVLCNGRQIDVDTLFDNTTLFSEGEDVCLTVRKENCVNI
ncbi:MAG: ABC transporter ATP-binding protein [Lachnospiraceae bacterium]|nr:ABC transporter ATP-binding protein [Lachnospiraceae bacterium]